MEESINKRQGDVRIALSEQSVNKDQLEAEERRRMAFCDIHSTESWITIRHACEPLTIRAKYF